MTEHLQRNLDRHLLAGLSRAVDWLDNSLQNVLKARGCGAVHRTQSLILVHIASGVDAPADIARAMGLSRQNVHHMAQTLIRQSLIEQVVDPDDPRRARYRLCDDSAGMQAAALETLHALEKLIRQRSGVTAAEFAMFRKVLTADWGTEVTSPEELPDIPAPAAHVVARGRGKNQGTSRP